MTDEPKARIDQWLWAVRLTKTRSAAATACKGGRVRIDGARVKPSTLVRPGMRVELTDGARLRIAEVTKVIAKRVGAPVAAECYIDHSPPPPPRILAAPIAVRDAGAGRPTKRERREIDRLRGR